MITEIDFIPVPADTSLYDTDTQYLALDTNGEFHVARWDGSQLLLDGSVVATEGEEADAEDVDLVLIAVMPDIEMPSTL